MGVTQALLTWSNTNGSASYRMLLESFGNSPELTPHLPISFSGLTLGAQSNCSFPESKETQNDLLVTEGVLQNCASGSECIIDWILKHTVHVFV